MNNRPLHRFAVLTAVATLALLGAGGLVTSHGAGMAVPDWPNTFGYNMFFFPFSQWVGGVFYEHTHRLLASGVGLLTSILAIWLYGQSARRFLRWSGIGLLLLGMGTRLALPQRWADALVLGVSGLAALGASLVWPRCAPAPAWLRKLGMLAIVAVVLQGILGGLRVVLFKDQIGIFHATLAQLFFALICALALFTSRWWEETFARYWNHESLAPSPGTPDRLKPGLRTGGLARLCLGATLLILAQLILGATMRHQHAGLAIPDFPLAYGKIWPATDSQSVARYNQQRMEIVAANPVTAAQITLQMIHRLGAVVILAMITCCAWCARRELGIGHIVSRLALGWLGLLVTQALLGAATIWSNKAADIATAHVLVGALSLALGAILSIILLSEPVLAHQVRNPAFRRQNLGNPVIDTSESVPPKGATPNPGSFGAPPAPALGIE